MLLLLDWREKLPVKPNVPSIVLGAPGKGADTLTFEAKPLLVLPCVADACPEARGITLKLELTTRPPPINSESKCQPVIFPVILVFVGILRKGFVLFFVFLVVL